MNNPKRIWAWCFNEWEQGWGGYCRQNNLRPLDGREADTGAVYVLMEKEALTDALNELGGEDHD